MAESEVKRMSMIIRVLRRHYPEAKCSLNFKTPFQLLVSTILSAQCTDDRVNRVTPALFKKFPGPKEMAGADLKEIERLIQSTGFFRSKARSILEASCSIVEKHGGEVPGDLDSLIKLRGVGRKTANVVLGTVFSVPGLVVDTHVGRISRRMGFTRSHDPEKVEQELMRIVSRKDWVEYSHLLIAHGREVCTARRAYCEDCPIRNYCPKVGVLNS